jgi:tetratricopeptide (TPR) repeat protein
LPQPVEPLQMSPPLRILGMVTSPSGLDPLDVKHEKRLVEEATRGLREDGLLELTWLEGQTWRHLQRAMRRGPWHIFHFVGHGGFDPATEEGAIALSNDTGHMHLLRARSLAELLDDHYPLRLVFLNSCEGARGSESDAFSSTAATLVRRGVPAVVAMQYEVTDGAAIEFSRDFYEALADSLPVDAAVTEARAAVSMDSILEWGIPVLYMHSPDGRVFDVLAAAPRAHPPPETEYRQEEEPLRQYRESVESAWVDGKLQVNEVQRLRDLASNELRLSPGTAADIEREVMGDTIEAILKRQEQMAEEEERRNQLDQLYSQARRALRVRAWQTVVELFEEIRAEDADYPDPEGLLASARDALDAQERTQRIATLYDRGQRHMKAEEWQQALERFEEVQRLEPGYQETETLLSQVRKELAPPPRVEVPGLVNQEVSRARSTLANKGLKLGAQREAPSDTSPEGQIVGQSPEAGKEVQTGASVSVTVSSGPSTVEIPDLVGKSSGEARTMLHDAGLRLDMVGKVPSDEVAEANIVEQDLAAGSKVERGTSVRVTVAQRQIEEHAEEGAPKRPFYPRPDSLPDGLEAGSQMESASQRSEKPLSEREGKPEKPQDLPD